jgi:tetratricopeptide (TPR) repeat protein
VGSFEPLAPLTVLVSYPGDAREAASRVREALLRWHTATSLSAGVSLVVKWWPDDAISDAEFGADGQAMFNQRVGDLADIVFAVFQGRAFAATTQSLSGTAEEVERAALAGKPVHVFFPTIWADVPRLGELRHHFETSFGTLISTWSELSDLDEMVNQALESDLNDPRVMRLPAAARRKHLAFGPVPEAARVFQGRDVLRDRVAQAWAGGHGTVVLSGDAGHGKTQLAAWFARQARDAADNQCDILLWIPAGRRFTAEPSSRTGAGSGSRPSAGPSSRTVVELGYARAAANLGLVAENVEPTVGAARLVDYLSTRSAESWLLVLDGLDADFDEMIQAGLIPSADGLVGKMLVTTRYQSRTAGTQNRALIRIGVYDPDEAVRFLAQAANLPHNMSDGAAQLARKLGYLPLTLSIAAGVIRDTHQPPGVFLEQFLAKRSLREGLGRFDPDGYPVALADAWAVTVDHLNKVDPSGGTVRAALLAALLDPVGHPGIIWDVLAGSEFVVTGSDLTNDESSGLVDAGQTRRAPDTEPSEGRVPGVLTRLADYSLVTLDGWRLGMVGSMHPVTALAVQDYYNRTHQAGDIVEAVSALVNAFDKSVPSDAAVTLDGLRLVASNLVHLAVNHQDRALWKAGLIGLASRVVNWLGDRGAVFEAVALCQVILPAAERVLGADHPDTLTTRSNLAYYLGEAGQVSAAVEQLKVLLEDRTCLLGPNHPDTLLTRDNSAELLGRSGLVGDAAEQLIELLEGQARVLGADHPDTLTTRNNLAYYLGEAGKVDEAIEQLKILLDDQTVALGADHPDRLRTRNDFAYWLGRSGRIDEAIEQFEVLLEDQARILGPDHPGALRTRSSLAYWLGRTSHADKAVEQFKVLLEDLTRVLGPDHPDTLRTRRNLAFQLGLLRRMDEAVEQLRTLLGDLTRVIGTDDPATLTTRRNLAAWLNEAYRTDEAVEQLGLLVGDRTRIQGPDDPATLTAREELAMQLGRSRRYGEAIEQSRALLEDRIRVLGRNHPDTLLTRRKLVGWLSDAYQLDDEMGKLKAQLEDRLRVLGPDHPDTLAARDDLAHWLTNAGQIDEAASQFKALLEAQARVLGPDHPDRLTTRSTLAYRFCDYGRVEEAAEQFELLLEDQLRVLGPDHPDTLTTRREWAGLLDDTGRQAEAIEQLEIVVEVWTRVLGTVHRDTLRARDGLAYQLGDAGRVTEAVELLESLLEDQARVLGPNHPDTARTRHRLASWRGAETIR